MKRCTFCGAPNPDSANFCGTCGARLAASSNSGGGYQNRGPQYGYDNRQRDYGQRNVPPQDYGRQGYGPHAGRYASYYSSFNGYMIQPRSIVLAVLLSIITCGIYSLYWIYRITEDLNLLTGNYRATSGGMVVLFTIITCGIYGLYWAYKMGQNCSMINGDASGGALNLILAIFGLQIINMALFQDTINRHV